MDRERRRDWTTVVLSTLIALVLAFAAVEAYVRLSFEYQTPDTLRQQSGEYETALFARAIFPQKVQKLGAKGAIIINSRGYRGDEFALPKPDNIARIVFLGGSAVFDLWANGNNDWPHLTGKALKERGKLNIEVINAAVPGHSSEDSLGRLYSEIWMFDPDYIVVSHAWNDIKKFRKLSLDNSLLRLSKPGSTKKHWPSNANADDWLIDNPFIHYRNVIDKAMHCSQIYARIRRRYFQWKLGIIGLEGIVVGQTVKDPDYYSGGYDDWELRQLELNMKLILDASRDVGAVPVLITQPHLAAKRNDESDRKKIEYHYVEMSHEVLVRAFDDVDSVISNIARAKEVALLDLSGTLSGRSELFVDHVHTTPAGSRAIADAVSEFLAGVMADEADTDTIEDVAARPRSAAP